MNSSSSKYALSGIYICTGSTEDSDINSYVRTLDSCVKRKADNLASTFIFFDRYHHRKQVLHR